MVSQKMIANIFTEFRDLYTGKKAIGIRPLCEKYENHPMLMGLLTNMEAAAEIEVPQAMKEIYDFYKEYRGKDLNDEDWETIVERTGRMVKERKNNLWYRRVILEVVNLLEDDDRERRRIAKEVEKEMEEAAGEQEAA
ncbi:hypothetical protein [Ruminococcus sp. 5_1_39BFAA]|uniref:hypothetical protein n=1 Tax=Ruminococcus sp. 5_1_39BFAA TaxID=457412 RepID=UPI0035698D01